MKKKVLIIIPIIILIALIIFISNLIKKANIIEEYSNKLKEYQNLTKVMILEQVKFGKKMILPFKKILQEMES